jgi:ABC-type phosphate transport system auxiliary subunit
VVADLQVRARVQSTSWPVLAATFNALRPELRRIQEQLFEEELYHMQDVSARQHHYPLSARVRAWFSGNTSIRRAAKKYFTGSED